MTTPPMPLRLATVSPDGVRWCLKRNCSASPRQVLGLFVLISGVSLGVALLFWFQGATLVMPFALAEVAALAVALWVYARHAADAERIVLQGGRLRIEQEVAGRCTVVEFVRDWVSVDADGSLVRLSGQGQRVAVGRHLRSHLRPALLAEIRWAVRSANAL